jgi:hypothetical protein
MSIILDMVKLQHFHCLNKRQGVNVVSINKQNECPKLRPTPNRNTSAIQQKNKKFIPPNKNNLPTIMHTTKPPPPAKKKPKKLHETHERLNVFANEYRRWYNALSEN